MSVSTTTVIYELVGRDSASPAFRSAGNSAATAESRLSSLGKAASKVGLALAGVAVAVGTESARMAVTFQTQMEKIHTQAGGTQKDVQSLTQSVLKLAPATQQGPQQLAEALYHLKSLGMDNAMAMKALATSSNLAAVGGASLEETASAIGAAWRSGIKGGQDFSNIAATVNAIIGAGNMQMGDFVSSLSTGILPAARTFGASLKSVGSAMALMTDEGVPAQLAATRLRMSLSLLGAPSVTASKYLAEIGLTGTQLGNAMRSPGGLIAAVSLLKDHLDASGLSATQQAQVISRAFGGGQSSSAIMTMLNNLDVLKKKQDQINNSVSNYGSDVTAQRKTAQAQFDLLKSTLDTLGIKIGLALLPPITKFTSYLNAHALPLIQSAIKWLTSPDVKPWAELVGKLALGAIAANAIYTGLQKAAALTGLDKVFSAAKSTGTATAAANMGSAAKMQLDASLNMLKAAGMQADAAGTSTASGAATGAESSGLAGGILGKLGLSGGLTTPIGWGAVIGAIIKAGGDTLAPAHTAAGHLNQAIQTSGFGGPVASGTGGYLGSAAANKNFQATAAAVSNWFTESLPHAWSLSYEDFQRDFAGKITAWFTGSLPHAFTSDVPAAGKWLYQAGKNLYMGFANGVYDETTGMADWIWKHIAEPFIHAVEVFFGIASPSTVMYTIGGFVVLGFLNGMAGKLGAVVAWAGKLRSRVTGELAGAGNWLVSEGRAALSGLWSGMKDAWSDVSGWLSGLGAKIKSLKGPEDKDAKLLVDEGNAIISGLLTGMKKGWSVTSSWLSSLGSKIKTAAKYATTDQDSPLAKFLTADNKKLQTLAAQRAKIAASISAATSLASSVTSNALSGAQLTSLESVTGGGTFTQSTILADMQAQLALIRKFGTDLKTLKKLGLDSDLLQQVINAGPQEGDALAQAIIQSGAAGVKQLNSTQAALNSAATQLGYTAGNVMYDSGKKAGQGFVSGLKAQEKAIDAEMTAIAKNMVNVIKKELGIKSPSKVTFQLAAFAGMGIEHGLLSRRNPIKTAAQRLAQDAVPNLTPQGSDGAWIDNPRTGGGDITVNVNHVPGYSTPSDVKNAIAVTSRQLRLARRR